MKLLVLSLLLTIGVTLSLPKGAIAQTSVVTASRIGSTTNTAASTSTITTSFKGQPNNFDAVTVQVIGTKTSGTPAGKVILYGSLNDTDFFAIGKDTLTIGNVTRQTHTWLLDKTRALYYQLQVVTTGTSVTTWWAYILGRKEATQ